MRRGRRGGCPKTRQEVLESSDGGGHQLTLSPDHEDIRRESIVRLSSGHEAPRGDLIYNQFILFAFTLTLNKLNNNVCKW